MLYHDVCRRILCHFHCANLSLLKMINSMVFLPAKHQKASFPNFQPFPRGQTTRNPEPRPFFFPHLDNHWWHSMHHTCSDQRAWPCRMNHQIRCVPSPSWHARNIVHGVVKMGLWVMILFYQPMCRCSWITCKPQIGCSNQQECRMFYLLFKSKIFVYNSFRKKTSSIIQRRKPTYKKKQPGKTKRSISSFGIRFMKIDIASTECSPSKTLPKRRHTNFTGSSCCSPDPMHHNWSWSRTDCDNTRRSPRIVPYCAAAEIESKWKWMETFGLGGWLLVGCCWFSGCGCIFRWMCWGGAVLCWCCFWR